MLIFLFMMKNKIMYFDIFIKIEKTNQNLKYKLFKKKKDFNFLRLSF